MKFLLSALFCVLLFECSIFDVAASLYDGNSSINLNSADDDTLIAAHVVSKSFEIKPNLSVVFFV